MTPELADALAALNAEGALWFRWIVPAVLLLFTGFVIGWVHDRWLRIGVTSALLSTVAFIRFCGDVHLMLADMYAGVPMSPESMVVAMEAMVLTTKVAGGSLVFSLLFVIWQIQSRTKTLVEMIPAAGGEDQ